MRSNRREIKALTFRREFGKTLDDVAQKGMHIVVTRANKPLAVLVPVEDYESGLHRTKRLQQVAVRMDEWRKKHGGQLPGGTVEAIRQIRSEA